MELGDVLGTILTVEGVSVKKKIPLLLQNAQPSR